jgi:ABC-type polysaccharide/polyol phosphate transport system ATPase subunit
VVNKGLWLQQGQVQAFGAISDVIEDYQAAAI